MLKVNEEKFFAKLETLKTEKEALEDTVKVAIASLKCSEDTKARVAEEVLKEDSRYVELSHEIAEMTALCDEVEDEPVPEDTLLEEPEPTVQVDVPCATGCSTTDPTLEPGLGFPFTAEMK